mmetsp:Transcript_62706/g.149601  ORF Transcript_62706/g.149601 Transcript_62706/m.149601 type:complete len:424 (+) Transcript_62706:146-1417(+)
MEDGETAGRRGLWYLKILLPNHLVGSVIGKHGAHVLAIETESDCEVRVSKAEDRYPGTTDRVVVMSGEPAGLRHCLEMVMSRMHHPTDRDCSGKNHMAKLAIPCTAVNIVIGHKGEAVRQVRLATDCKVTVLKDIPGFHERIVLIGGYLSNVTEAVWMVCRAIQRDKLLKEYMDVSYDAHLPLGIWHGDKPLSSEVALIDPQDTGKYSKRQLILYLTEAAPQEVLLRYRLVGQVHNILKSNTLDTLTRAVAETFKARAAEGGLDGTATVSDLPQQHGEDSSASTCPAAGPDSGHSRASALAQPSQQGEDSGETALTVTQAATDLDGNVTVYQEGVHPDGGAELSLPGGEQTHGSELRNESEADSSWTFSSIFRRLVLSDFDFSQDGLKKEPRPGGLWRCCGADPATGRRRVCGRQCQAFSLSD